MQLPYAKYQVAAWRALRNATSNNAYILAHTLQPHLDKEGFSYFQDITELAILALPHNYRPQKQTLEALTELSQINVLAFCRINRGLLIYAPELRSSGIESSINKRVQTALKNQFRDEAYQCLQALKLTPIDTLRPLVKKAPKNISTELENHISDMPGSWSYGDKITQSKNEHQENQLVTEILHTVSNINVSKEEVSKGINASSSPLEKSLGGHKQIPRAYEKFENHYRQDLQDSVGKVARYLKGIGETYHSFELQIQAKELARKWVRLANNDSRLVIKLGDELFTELWQKVAHLPQEEALKAVDVKLWRNTVNKRLIEHERGNEVNP